MKAVHLTNRDRDQVDMFNISFSSVFNIENKPRGSQCPKLEDHNCENDQLLVNTEIARDVLLQLDPYKSMAPDWIHPGILKDLADVIAKPFLIFEQSWESRDSSCLEVGEHCSSFQEGQEGEPQKLQTCQCHFST
ncbi:hypothetical protein WISP_94501 [Willisornis vidua]|uniref:Uncharacterized protein n=1 Tax=Willisornis vidua TaxID=1566151 RepID=A0ABQ9D3C4_9PASS|nr:hypothetical protein WISP_94501 [Willisornis vidua]